VTRDLPPLRRVIRVVRPSHRRPAGLVALIRAALCPLSPDYDPFGTTGGAVVTNRRCT
jgi:hypothetical protein